MKTFAPLQIEQVGKSFVLVLLLLTVAWAAVSLLVLGDIYVARPILIANLVLAAILGWAYYRYRYHVLFAYGPEGFRLQQGRALIGNHEWREFARVSLVHLGGGQLALRLYLREPVDEGRGKTEAVEIPASAVGLDAFALRDEIAAYVRAADSGHD